MKRVAVIAHAGKSMGGGLDELRQVLTRAGVDDPLWSEVPKSPTPERVEKALAEAQGNLRLGQRRHDAARVDAMAGGGAPCDSPAGTANLFASNLHSGCIWRPSTSGSMAGSGTRPREDERRALRSWPAQVSTRA
jgi:hypothetical protein